MRYSTRLPILALTALAGVLLAGGCSSGSPRSGSAATSTACSTPARPWLRAGGSSPGSVRWVVRLASCFSGDQTVSQGLPTEAVAVSPSLTVALFGNTVWAVDTATGQVRWSEPVALPPPPAPPPDHTEFVHPQMMVLGNDVVIAEDMNGSNGASCCAVLAVADLNAANGATRRVRWFTMPEGSTVGADILGGKVAFIVSAPQGQDSSIGVVDPATGRTWSHALRIADTFAVPVLAAVGNVLYTDTPTSHGRERSLLAYSLLTGAQLPSLRLPEPTTNIVGSAGGLLLIHGQVPSGVDAVDPATGALKMRSGALYASRADASQHIVWGWAFPGLQLQIYDLGTGRLRPAPPIAGNVCDPSGANPALPNSPSTLYTAVTPATVLCPQRADPHRVNSVVRLQVVSLSTGHPVGRTIVLPDWTSDNVSGQVAVGITCQGPNPPATDPTTGVCGEYDLAGIDAG